MRDHGNLVLRRSGWVTRAVVSDGGRGMEGRRSGKVIIISQSVSDSRGTKLVPGYGDYGSKVTLEWRVRLKEGQTQSLLFV